MKKQTVTQRCFYACYKYWNRIDGEQAIMQPFLFAGANSVEFVIIFCFLWVFFAFFSFDHR